MQLSSHNYGRPSWLGLFSVLVFIVSHATAAPLAADGPYVIQQPNGTWLASWVEGDDAELRVRDERASVGRRVVVHAVGASPEFSVQLRTTAPMAPDKVALAADTPLFVVADTHGEYQILAELLKKQRILDGKLRWSFGRGHLVILGDVFDRGPNQTEILWLIYELEAQAAKAGGGVHLVLGNHEVMVLKGDLRYLNPKYVQTARALGVGGYSELVGPRTVLGQWLRTKPAVLKIGNLLCLHGGISREVVERNLTLSQLNAAVRDTLNGGTPPESDKEQVAFVIGQLGPLWYRGYFADQKDFPTATSEDIDDIREHFAVERILVGHTTVPSVTPLYGGRVIAVQVYPHLEEKSGRPVMEALRIEKGQFMRARIDGAVEPLETQP